MNAQSQMKLDNNATEKLKAEKRNNKALVSVHYLNSLTAKMNVSDIAARIGMSASSIYSYIKENRAPIVVELACKSILNEIGGNNSPTAKELIIFRANKEDAAMVCRMLGGLNIKYSRFTD